MSDWGRKLIADAIGPRLGNENVKQYQRRCADEVCLGFASVVKLWKGEYASKPTLSKLERAADNAQKLASKFDQLATRLEADGGDRRDVEALRDLARRYRRIDHGAGPRTGAAE